MKPARIRTFKLRFDRIPWYLEVYPFRNESPYPTLTPPVLPSNGQALRHGDLDRNEDEWWARPDVI